MSFKTFLPWIVTTVVVAVVLSWVACKDKNGAQAKTAVQTPCMVDFAHFDREQCIRFIEWKILVDLGDANMRSQPTDSEIKILRALETACPRPPLPPEKP